MSTPSVPMDSSRDGAAPVSYTHLDVYKRQITVHINIARSADEAERQSRGENVLTSQFEEERAMDAAAAADLLEGGAGQVEHVTEEA